MNNNYRGFRDLKVFQLSYKLAVEIFKVTLNFPKEEKYSLTDQIRRSSRSVPANIAEAWSRRKYLRSFVNKLVESDGESSETTVWLDFARDQNYINFETYTYFKEKYSEVGKMLGSMIHTPEKFCH